MPHDYTPKESKNFFKKVKVMPSGCHEWQGSLNGRGYGSLGIKYATRKAHRVAWELAYGLIPDGMSVLHTCDNRRCVNPDHLFLGTQADNMHDMKTKDRVANGERLPQSKLTEKDVCDIRKAHDDGESQRSIATRYGVNQSSISLIVSRKTWRRIE